MIYLSIALLFPLLVSGLRLPVRSIPAKRSIKLTSSKGSTFSKLKPETFALKPQNNQVLNLTDNQDLIYIVDCTIGDQDFPLQLDSGSSDLWVDLTGKSIIGKTTGLSLNMSYGIGYIAGPIATAPVSFAGFNVSSQAYIAGTDVNNPATDYGANGVLGMGFTSLSSVDATVNASGASYGRSLLYNIFLQHPDEPNFVAYKLQRHSENDGDDEGEFTIGELSPEFSNVPQTGKIATFPQINPNRWTLLVDKIIASGQSISLGSSVVSDAPSGKLVALPDTGTSLVFAPRAIIDAIYANIPGATFNSGYNAYVLDCSVEVDVSVVINNRQFDVHPLDIVQIATTDADGKPVCVGSWRPQSFTVGVSEFDLLLGVAFMRSVYSVYDFGDFASDNKTMGDPYMLLWSTVNGSDASTEFHSIRGGTKNSTFLSNAGVNGPSADSVPESSSGTGNAVSGPDLVSMQSSIDKLNKLIPILFALTGLNLAVLLGIAAMFFCKKSSRRGKAAGRSRAKARSSPPPGEQTELPPAASPETPGSFIALPRPRAPGLQAEYRPLSTGSTMRDSTLYDAPRSPGFSKFGMDGGRYDPHIRQSVADIPEESSMGGGSARHSLAASLPPGARAATPQGHVPFPRESIVDDVQMPPPALGDPDAARRSTAETLVTFPATSKTLEEEKLGTAPDSPARPRDPFLTNSTSLSPNPRVPFGLTPPEARYDPTTRHSYADYSERPKISFEQPVRRSVISGESSGGEVTFDPLLRRSVHRTPSSPDFPRDPFLSPQQPRTPTTSDIPTREPSPLSQAVLHPEEESSKDV